MWRTIIITITALTLGVIIVLFIVNRNQQEARSSLILTAESEESSRQPHSALVNFENDTWFVEFDFTATLNAGIDGGAAWDGKGDVEIELPESGQIRGKNKYSIKFEMNGLFSCTQIGSFSVDGEVHDNIFIFTPTLESQGMTCTPSGGAMNGILPPNAGLAFPNEPISLEIKNGSAFTQQLYPGTGFNGQITWRLKGLKREQWEINFSGQDQWTRGFGSYSDGQIGAGIKVNWTVDVIAEIEDDACEANATINILPVESVSDPPETFMVTSEIKPSSSQNIRCQKNGRSVRIAFPLDRDPRGEDGWGYWWSYEFEVTSNAMDIMREAGIPPVLAQEVMRGFGNQSCRMREGGLTCSLLSFPPGTEPERSDEGSSIIPNRTDWYTISLVNGDQSESGIYGERILVRKIR